MTLYILLAIACAAATFLFFRWYNNGLGRLTSFMKRLRYVLALASFIGFIIFLNKAFYYIDNQEYKTNIDSITNEYIVLERILWESEEYSDNVLKEMQLNFRDFVRDFENSINQGHDSLTGINDLILKYYEDERLAIAKKDSFDKKIQEQQSTVKNLTVKLERRIRKENANYINFVTNILSAFIAFVIAFTFKNEILG